MKKIILLFSIFLIFAGCENPMDLVTSEKNTVELRLAVNGSESSNARTVSPDSTTAVAEYELFGSLDGGSVQNLGHWSDLSTVILHLEVGTWDFSLNGKDSSGNVFVQAELTQVTLRNQPVNLVFALEPLAEGQGVVEIKLNWPASIDVSSIVPTFDGSAGASIDTTGVQTATFIHSVEKGGYLLFLSLRDSNDREIALIPEYVKVLVNMTSAAEYTLEETDFNSAPKAPTDFTVGTGEDFDTEATGKLAFSWTDNSINELKFELEESEDGSSGWVSVDNEITAGSTTLKIDLDRGLTRYYRLRAVNNFGESAWINVIPASYTVPWLVTFNTDEGSEVVGQEIATGGVAMQPVDPEKYGKLFGGWYTDNTFSTTFDFATTINTNITVYAKWTSAVVFNAGNGEGSMSTIDSWAEGSTHALPVSIFTRSGYDFVGWSKELYGAVVYADGANYTMGASGDTLYARWNRSDAALASEFTVENDTTYGGVRITRYNGNPDSYGGHVIIPDMIGGKPVTSIKDNSSYYGRSNYNSAFNYNWSNRYRLSEVTLPETLVKIGNNSFRTCNNLTQINFTGDKLRLIGSGVFFNSGFSELSFPHTVKSIGADSFNDCNNLVSVSMPGVNIISESLFRGCEKLETIDWGSELTRIENYAFYGCQSIPSTFVVPDSVTSIGQHAFYEVSSITEIRLPDKNISLGQNVFARMANLDTVDLGNKLTSIPSQAFNNCDSLESINLPDTVVSIGSNAFADCNKLKNIDFGNSLEIIGEYAMERCNNIEQVILPDSVKTIGREAFDDCSKLQTIYLGNSLLTIDSYAFRNCRVLQSIEIPDTVYYMGTEVFSGCWNLASVKLSTGLAVIPNNTFDACSSISEIVIPDAVTTIGAYAFRNNNALRKLTLGTGLTSIGNNAFEKCRSLEQVTLPDALTSLGTQAFIDCDNIKSVTFGNGLKTISEKAFWCNRNLENIHFGTSLVSIDAQAFGGCIHLKGLDFPESLRSIGDSAFGSCESVVSIDFKPYVRSIGSSAFSGLDSLVSVDLPRDLTSLGNYAFNNCRSLETLTMGDALIVIPEYSFKQCGKLQNFTLGSSISTISKGAFESCNSLTKLDLSSVTTIDDYAFAYNAGLQEVILGSYINSISTNAFNSCSSLETVKIKALIPPNLGVAAFSGNSPNRKFYVTNMEDNSVLEAYKVKNNWHLMADSIVEGDFTPPEGMLKVGVYSSQSNTNYRIRGLAFNSGGELFGIHDTNSQDKVYGPLTSGFHTADYPIYAVGGSSNPVALVFDNDDYLYTASLHEGNIYRIADGGGTLVRWNMPSEVVSGDRDPVWMGIAPSGFDGASINPGDLVVLDSHWNNGTPFTYSNSYVMRFSPADASDRSLFFTGDNSTFSDPYSAAFGDNMLYVAAARGLFGIDADGNCTKLSGNPAMWISVHPVKGKVYFGGSNNPAKVWCYDPATGETIIAAYIPSLLFPDYKTAVFTADGTKMLIPDGYRILELTGF